MENGDTDEEDGAIENVDRNDMNLVNLENRKRTILNLKKYIKKEVISLFKIKSFSLHTFSFVTG